jgi:uncharacterized membrane protein
LLAAAVVVVVVLVVMVVVAAVAIAIVAEASTERTKKLESNKLSSYMLFIVVTLILSWVTGIRER